MKILKGLNIETISS